MIINKSSVIHTCLNVRSGTSYEVRYLNCLLIYLKHHALKYINGTTKIKKLKKTNKLTKSSKDRHKPVDPFVHKLY